MSVYICTYVCIHIHIYIYIYIYDTGAQHDHLHAGRSARVGTSSTCVSIDSYPFM